MSDKAETDTPMTSAASFCDEYGNRVVHEDFSEELERKLTAANAEVERYRIALEANVPRCQCGEIGIWEWVDEDGSEYCCDKHKNKHFYANGPHLDKNAVLAREALTSNQKERKDERQS